MAAATVLLTFFVAGLALATSELIKGVSANVDGVQVRSHEAFVPLVAFKCGFRNQYMTADGSWKSDDSALAKCFHGKYDILKYCKRVYPGKNVTNIVEYSHQTEVSRWCKEDGTQCKHTFIVQPYQCIVGEFVTESLQVPGQCHFAHVMGRSTCQDYKYWSGKAGEECDAKSINGEKMTVRSFAILEPCGLDMFRGVEFVCCPKTAAKTEDPTPIKKIEETDIDEDENDDDEDDSDLNDDEESVEDDDEHAHQDPYFQDDDTKSEHERFRDVEERLEKRHRKKVTKVITEWSNLFDRYNKMKEADPNGADNYKREMTSRFRKTVASLEEENRELRRQVEEVHDQRVQEALNEKKRQATHEYRAALAMQVGAFNKQNVLKSLKNYIRAEEKDRTHMINRFRHLLRTDQDEAVAFEKVLLHRLRNIDLRINGTLAMLRDFPTIEKQIRPIAIEFWREHRRENTPGLTVDELESLDDTDANVKLIDLYKQASTRLGAPSSMPSFDFDSIKDMVSTPAPKVNLGTIITAKTEKPEFKSSSESTSSDEDDDDDDDESDEDDDDDENDKNAEKKPAKDEKLSETVEDDSNDDEDDDDDSESTEEFSESSEKAKRLRVVIEPIVRRPIRIEEDAAEHPSFARHEKLVNEIQMEESSNINSVVTTSNLLVIVVASATLFAALFFVAIRRRVRHPGFIEVDVCTPEERHVAGMQVNGYENPTYTFFDGKP